MTTALAEQIAWQRRAAAVLADLLKRAARENLPVLSWTISPAGAGLTGRAVSYPAAGRREHVTAWAQALGIKAETRTHGGATEVRAVAEQMPTSRGFCTIALLADIYADEGDSTDDDR